MTLGAANLMPMILGVHAMIYARDAEKARAFFRDVLKFPFVDAGQGWLIFALPPAEVGVHPIMPNGLEEHRINLMVTDIKKAVRLFEKHGVQCAPIQEAGFGLLASFELPGGGPMGMYQPRHPLAIGKRKRPAKVAKKAAAAKKPARKKPTKKATKKPTKKKRAASKKPARKAPAKKKPSAKKKPVIKKSSKKRAASKKPAARKATKKPPRRKATARPAKRKKR